MICLVGINESDSMLHWSRALGADTWTSDAGVVSLTETIRANGYKTVDCTHLTSNELTVHL